MGGLRYADAVAKRRDGCNGASCDLQRKLQRNRGAVLQRARAVSLRRLEKARNEVHNLALSVICGDLFYWIGGAAHDG